MTILGKVLVFVVLVLSIVWNALVVNAYVTRTNWQAEAKRSQAKAKEAADSATAVKNLVDEERSTAAERERSYREDRDRLYVQNAQLLKDRDELSGQVNNAFAQQKGLNAQAGILQANIDKLQKQVDTLDQQIREANKQLTDLTLQAQRDRVAAGEAQRDAAMQQQRVDRWAQKVQQLTDELAEYKQRYGELQGRGTPKAPSLPVGFRGTVSRTEGSAQDIRAGRDVLVEFTPGLDAGVRQGAVMTVYRRQGASGKYLGTLTVVSANAKDGVGRFTPANAKAVGADDLPKAGDELMPNTR
jgi:predicted RNase H-like nuclease (RuvC/YqgF family)